MDVTAKNVFWSGNLANRGVRSQVCAQITARVCDDRSYVKWIDILILCHSPPKKSILPPSNGMTFFRRMCLYVVPKRYHQRRPDRPGGVMQARRPVGGEHSSLHRNSGKQAAVLIAPKGLARTAASTAGEELDGLSRVNRFRGNHSQVFNFCGPPTILMSLESQA